jgi:hypothetical protein
MIPAKPKNHLPQGSATAKLSHEAQESITAQTRHAHPDLRTLYTPGLLSASPSIGIASILPKHTTATCSLDQILLDFTQSRRSMAAKGYSMDLVLGFPHPSVQAVLYPGPPTPEVHDTNRV